MVDESGHSHIVKGEEIILGASVCAWFLNIFDRGAFKSDFADESAEIWIRFVELAQSGEEFSGIQSESGKIRDFGTRTPTNSVGEPFGRIFN